MELCFPVCTGSLDTLEVSGIDPHTAKRPAGTGRYRYFKRREGLKMTRPAWMDRANRVIVVLGKLVSLAGQILTLFDRLHR